MTNTTMRNIVLDLVKQEALIFALIAVFGGFSPDGRLTDWTCWMLILAIVPLVVFVGRVEYGVVVSKTIDERTLPRWLQD